MGYNYLEASAKKDKRVQGWALWRDSWKFFNLEYVTIPIQVSYYRWSHPEKIEYRYLHVFGFRIARWRV